MNWKKPRLVVLWLAVVIPFAGSPSINGPMDPPDTHSSLPHRVPGPAPELGSVSMVAVTELPPAMGPRFWLAPQASQRRVGVQVDPLVPPPR